MFMDRDGVEVLKHAKKRMKINPAILTEKNLVHKGIIQCRKEHYFVAGHSR